VGAAGVLPLNKAAVKLPHLVPVAKVVSGDAADTKSAAREVRRCRTGGRVLSKSFRELLKRTTGEVRHAAHQGELGA
jgi:hypothetical protein